jgi:hypothetical protein
MTVSVIALLLCGLVAGEDGFMPELRRAPDAALRPLPPIEIQDAKGWPARRAELREVWAKIIGPFPAERVPLRPEILTREVLDDHVRMLVRYRTDAESTNEAYILVPRDGKPSRPGVVVLHPTTQRTINDPVGLSGREAVHNALHLVRRGYVCVVPRNYLWMSVGDDFAHAANERIVPPPWKTGMAKMTWDAIRATDLLLELPGAGVDPERIGTFGHSLGGKEVLYHAAFDERVRAAVSCEGGVGISFSNWDAAWYLGRQVKAKDFGHDHHELIALIAPRALLVIGGESADGARSWPYIDANLPLWRMLGAGDRLGLLRHTHGHDFPPAGEQRQQVYQWMDHFLNVRGG